MFVQRDNRAGSSKKGHASSNLVSIFRTSVSGLLALGGLLLATSSAEAAVMIPKTSVTLAWDPSTSSDVTSYRIYYGVASGAYTNVVTATGTQATVTNLSIGTKYYFTATSVTSSGLQSEFSNEINYTPTTIARVLISMSSKKQPQVGVQGPAGYTYDVLTNSAPTGSTWGKVATITLDGNGFFQYTDPNYATNGSKYYRLQQASP